MGYVIHGHTASGHWRENTFSELSSDLIDNDVQYIDVKLLEGEHLTEEYQKLNPLHTIPMLKDDDFVVWDSHAICTYLVTVYGDDDSLYPKDPKKRAIVDQRLHFDTGTLFPATRGAVEPVFFLGCMNEILPIDQNKYVNLWAWFQRCSKLPLCKTVNEPGLQDFRELLKSKLE
ncbi:unnamed protein product [Arctia plantaginis]|uniref:GST N-terminal domain-containing protein n=1 Tax=Arctia plantaginis TaxID=874455 RepID=A0A8S0ZNT5_ARCPL|nr:unnamed protein product [Arctia plantaginis]